MRDVVAQTRQGGFACGALDPLGSDQSAAPTRAGHASTGRPLGLLDEQDGRRRCGASCAHDLIGPIDVMAAL
jgi:hypothetical protein